MPLGAHVSSSGGLSLSVERALLIGAECLQLFLCAPRRWLEPKHAEDEMARFRAAVSAAGLGPNFVHAIYLINLASGDALLQERSVSALAACAWWADRCGLAGVVVHLGSARGQPLEDAEQNIGTQLQRVLDRGGDVHILLENAAGSGQCLGATFAQIGKLIDRLDRHPRLGLCLDTAHAFASGYDLRTSAGVETTLAEIERYIGLDRLRVIHINDSKSPLGSAVDRHENIGQGHMGEAAFRRLLTHPRLAALPWILEVPGLAKEGPDRASIETLKRLAGRVPPV